MFVQVRISPFMAGGGGFSTHLPMFFFLNSVKTAYIRTLIKLIHFFNLIHSESQIYEYIERVFIMSITYLRSNAAEKMILMLIYQLHSYFRDINLPDLELKIKEVSLELSKT